MKLMEQNNPISEASQYIPICIYMNFRSYLSLILKLLRKLSLYCYIPYMKLHMPYHALSAQSVRDM